MQRPRLALALGSGSARGWAHIGVIRALERRGLSPDIIAGASVGALVGAASASGQLDVLEDWIRTLTRVDVWRLVDTTFSGGGVMRGNRLMKAIGERIEDQPIEDLPVSFAAVAADLQTGQELWLLDGPMLSAVRASSGLPGLFAPMHYRDRWMIDGGVVNPVPVSLCRALGGDVVIAVNLNTPYRRIPRRRRNGARSADSAADEARRAEEERENQAILERWAGFIEGLVDSWRSNGDADEGPGLFDVMSASINIMQDRITRSRMAGDPPDLMIAPELSHFQLMDFHRADEAIRIGEEAVERVADRLDEIIGYLGHGR